MKFIELFLFNSNTVADSTLKSSLNLSTTLPSFQHVLFSRELDNNGITQLPENVFSGLTRLSWL